jgi:uncharacterized membrane protein (UPF0127 family)
MRKRLLTMILLAGVLLLSGACSDGAEPAADRPLATLEVGYDGGTLIAELARSPEERGVGLAGRDELAAGAGMLFDLGDTRIPAFWMKDTRFPLDLLFIGEDKRIVSITADVQPEPGVADAALRRYSPPSAVRYVLELNGGAAARLELDAGDELSFELP